MTRLRWRAVAAPGTELRRTTLFPQHEALGARLVPFAGWEMPVSYAGVRAEHLAVRRAAGVFDVSHMGQVRTRGPEAEALLQRLVTNDVTKLAPGGAQYALLCREDGGVLDDLFSYRLADGSFLTVTNASNYERDLAWMRAHQEDEDAELADARDEFAMLAVQGPEARHHVASLSQRELPTRLRTAHMDVAGASALVCGTGYTGEDGVELLLAPDDAPTVWDALMARGITPCGLAARDTLRVEACFHLYGNDLSEDRNPIEAGLGWACREDTGFLGAGAVRAAREQGTAERLVPFALLDPGIPRQGNEVLGGGVVTSGTLSPCLEQGVGLAYVRTDRAEVGERIDIDVRGRVKMAEVRTRPLYGKD